MSGLGKDKIRAKMHCVSLVFDSVDWLMREVNVRVMEREMVLRVNGKKYWMAPLRWQCEVEIECVGAGACKNLKVNVRTSKILRFSLSDEREPLRVSLGVEQLEEVREFKYLGLGRGQESRES